MSLKFLLNSRVKFPKDFFAIVVSTNMAAVRLGVSRPFVFLKLF